jgi:hypothetical protein
VRLPKCHMDNPSDGARLNAFNWWDVLFVVTRTLDTSFEAKKTAAGAMFVYLSDAMTAPIPFDAPVMTATFPFSFPFFIVFLWFVLPGKWLAEMEEPAAWAIVGKCG